MNCNEHNKKNEFLDSLASNSIKPLILQSTEITSYSYSLKDNIFLNVFDLDIISAQLSATISNHLPKFSIISNMLDNISGNKSDNFDRLVQIWSKEFYSRAVFCWLGGFVEMWWTKCWCTLFYYKNNFVRTRASYLTKS